MIMKYLRYKKWYKAIKESGLFDTKYYLFTYPDVRKIGLDPIRHYIKFGADEGRNPSKEFDTSYYLEANPDVREIGINPLAHYVLYGKNEGRKAMIKKVIKSLKEDGVKTTAKKIKNKTTKNIKLKKDVTLSCFDEIFKHNNTKDDNYKEYESKKQVDTDIRLIAFYLPQFHPIETNDKAWGKGFTEWTNVTKALPQFSGHYQPRLAGELGYYDLRLIEVQKRQIELAKNYGLHGFCYHYYWFDGKKVMDKPLQQILDNKDLNFPFCINWANENWTKRWDGLDQEVILKQNHTTEDDLAFLEAIKPILTDSRYIKVNGKPLLMIYRPQLFPDIKKSVKRWREHAIKIGLGELYLVLSHAFEHIDPTSIGFDAATEFAPNSFNLKDITSEQEFFNHNYDGHVYDYNSAINYSIAYSEPKYIKFRSLCPSWDNEARKPGKGTTLLNSSPANYSKWLEYLLYYTNKHRKEDEKLIFINAWNEWAEGAYLEPDRKYGYAYLEETYKQVSKFSKKRLYEIESTQKGKKKNDTAVVLHLFYVDMWDEMKSYLKNLDNGFDLYINVNNDASFKMIQQIKKDYPDVVLFSCENRGRDILPFIEMMRYITPLKYKYICKIHTKKSLHRIDGDRWRKHLIASLLGSKERILKAKQMLDSKKVAIIVPRANKLKYSEWKGSNEVFIKSFARKANIKFHEDFDFPAGSMFWFKPEVMDKLIKHIDLKRFHFENSQIDGTKAHAVERIFGLLCLDRNEEIEEI